MNQGRRDMRFDRQIGRSNLRRRPIFFDKRDEDFCFGNVWVFRKLLFQSSLEVGFSVGEGILYEGGISISAQFLFFFC